MNHKIAKMVVSGCCAAALAACAAATVDESATRVVLPKCVLQDAEAGVICRAQVFDGAKLIEATRDQHGGFFIETTESNVTQARVAFFTATGYEPKVFAVKMRADESERVTLSKTVDARGAYIAGLVYRKTEPMDGAACGIESFVANKELVVTLGRARSALTTDNLGHFQEQLMAGRYNILVDGRHLIVDAPQGETTIVLVDVP